MDCHQQCISLLTTVVKRLKFSNRLITCIIKRKWTEVYNFIDEANLPDKTNTYALHQICGDSTAPIKTVMDIYNAYPKAALAKDNHQDTPIAIAVEAGFEEAVHFLAKVCPESCSICGSHGSTPLLSVIFSLKYNHMIDFLIEANPGAAFIRDDDGDNAFDFFFRHWNVFMRIVVHNPNILEKDLDDFIGHGSWKIRDIYENTCMFLKAAYYYRTGNRLDNSCLLHCALREETCHWAFCNLLMRLHPEQILTKDNDRNLPIHIIAASKEVSDENTFMCFDCFIEETTLVYVEFLNEESKYCCEYCLEREAVESINKSFSIRPVLKVHEIIKEMLAIAPQMVLVSDSEGNYPLHIAINNQHSYDIVYELFTVLPETGKIRDMKTKLVPFMLAAVGKWDNEVDQITITYQLLREDPHLVFSV